MEEAVTRGYLATSKYIPEKTSSLELTNFVDLGVRDPIIEGDVAESEIEDWICERGKFKFNQLKDNGRLRLLVQEATDPAAFQQGSITLPPSCWPPAIERGVLSAKVFEISTSPELILWTEIRSRNKSPTLDIILKWGSSKSSPGHKTVVSLSHCIATHHTIGLYKWTTGPTDPANHNPSNIFDLLKGSTSQIGNPFLLPVIILHHEINHIEARQRSLRRQVRKIDDSLGLRDGLQAEYNPFRWAQGVVDFEMLNRGIVEASAQLQKRKPGTYLVVLKELETAMEHFERFKGEMNTKGIEKGRNGEEHDELKSRVRFQIRRVEAMQRYFVVTSERLNAQVNALYNLIAQKDNKLNYLVSIESRRIAAASKYESSAMRTISILGVIFLPGAFVASVLSTSFFDFQTGSVSPKFWIYWAITVPLTLTVLLTWLYWYYTNKRLHEATDRGLEEKMPSAATRRVGNTFHLDKRYDKEM